MSDKLSRNDSSLHESILIYKEMKELIELGGPFSKIKDLQSKLLKSRVESELIKVRAHLIKREFAEATKILNGLSSQNDYLKGEISILFGRIHFLQNENEKSLCFIHQAFNSFDRACDDEGCFTSYQALSGIYRSMGLLELGHLFNCSSERFEKHNFQKANRLRGMAYYYLEKGFFDEAFKYADNAHQLIQKKMRDSYLASSFLLSELLFIRGDIKSSRQMLKAICASARGINREKAQLNLALLNHLERGAPLSKNLGQKLEWLSEHYYRWKVIDSLSDGDIENANHAWNSLILSKPAIYSDHFKLKSLYLSRSIFGVCLQHYMRNRDTESDLAQLSLGLSQLEKKLLCLLYKSQFKLIRKEELIEEIWEGEYDSKYDNRLYKLVERVRSRLSGYQILNINNSYKLNKC